MAPHSNLSLKQHKNTVDSLFEINKKALKSTKKALINTKKHEKVLKNTKKHWFNYSSSLDLSSCFSSNISFKAPLNLKHMLPCHCMCVDVSALG